MDHGVPFKPSNPPKQGHNKTLEKFPPYLEDPLKFPSRKNEEEEKNKILGWKHTHKKQTTPTPSVTTNFKNLKTEFPSIFRKI